MIRIVAAPVLPLELRWNILSAIKIKVLLIMMVYVSYYENSEKRRKKRNPLSAGQLCKKCQESTKSLSKVNHNESVIIPSYLVSRANKKQEI